MHPASPNMSSLPNRHVHLLLLLFSLGLQVPQAQGLPLKTDCNEKINEMTKYLEKPPPKSIDPEHSQILANNTLWKPNLDAFQKAIENFQNKSAIKKNLKTFQPCLPVTTATPTGYSIHIKEGDWDDFQTKLWVYLKALVSFCGIEK